ncbi:MAG: sulfurtransferase TusA family protein [Clostridiales bacterium]|nr:sulfurtransferase TusA family protein [Clostridiales bacterium]
MVQQEVKRTSPATLEVLVDNRTAVENVSRFARNKGYAISVTPEGSDFRLVLKK